MKGEKLIKLAICPNCHCNLRSDYEWFEVEGGKLDGSVVMVVECRSCDFITLSLSPGTAIPIERPELLNYHLRPLHKN